MSGQDAHGEGVGKLLVIGCLLLPKLRLRDVQTHIFG